MKNTMTDNEKNIRAILKQGEIYGYTHLSMLDLALRNIKSRIKASKARWKGKSKDERSAHAKMMVDIRNKK